MNEEQIRKLIVEWRRGCSCASPARPQDCAECTAALVVAIERELGAPSEKPLRQPYSTIEPCFDHKVVACEVCKPEDWLCGAQHSRENAPRPDKQRDGIPSESPMAWMVYLKDDPLGFDYMTFSEEERATEYSELYNLGEPIPLYCRSAFGGVSASGRWQPIDIAPRDGTVILLHYSRDALSGYASAMRPIKAIAVGYFDGFWVTGVPGGHSSGGGDNQFTHWMPLPHNPTDSSATNGR